MTSAEAATTGKRKRPQKIVSFIVHNLTAMIMELRSLCAKNLSTSQNIFSGIVRILIAVIREQWSSGSHAKTLEILHNDICRS